MKIVLLNQSNGGVPQIPSVAAGLASASSDLATLASLGVEHGVNYGLSHESANENETLTQTIKASFDVQLANMPSFVQATWFSHNVEPLPVTQGIRHGPADQPMSTDDSGYIDVRYLLTQNPHKAVKSAMRELASRTGYTYDANSPTLLSGGAVPTYTEFFNAMSACMAETMQYLQSQFNGKTLYDWRSGAKPLPWYGDGWWVNPSWETSPFAYYRPNRTADGTQVYEIGENGLVLSTQGEGTAYDSAYWDAGLLNQARKTAEHSRSFFSQAKAELICYPAYVSPSTDDIATVLPSRPSGAGYYPVGVGGGGKVRFVPRQNAKESIYKAMRWSWLEHYKAFGYRIGCYMLPCIDWWDDVDPHWGLRTSDEEWAEVKMAALFDPVTPSEAARHGIPEGLVCTGSVVFWNATDYYLRGLFGNTPKAYVNQTIDSGEYVARRNMARRAAGRTNVAVDWSGANDAAITANPWYQALAAILTEDLISRVEVTRNLMNRAVRRGAARQSTLASLVGGQ
jgi:hypothetical protein